jgi:hypothetical protein
MKDITVSQLIAHARALPTDGVGIEQAFKYAFAGSVTAIAVAKNAALCYKTDALMERIFELKIEVARLPRTHSFKSGIALQFYCLQAMRQCSYSFAGSLPHSNASVLPEGFPAL